MLPIQLRGDNLGERHKQLNALVNRAFDGTRSQDLYNQEDSSDADRLFKIDLAIKCRDVDYIVETLKSDDMLYVSRALKATWLITDDQYAHIINPEHLYTVLFPQMYNKAIGKLKSNIRLHLRSEERCEVFYRYHRSALEDPDGALAFLPYCSKNFIITAIDDIDILKIQVGTRYYKNYNKKATKLVILESIFTRICGRFLDLAEPILRKVHESTAKHLLAVLDFIAISHMDLYLRLLEDYGGTFSRFPRMTKSLSKEIARSKPEKIVNRLDVYLKRIDLSSVAKVWTKEQVESFIHVLSKSEQKEVKNWFDYNALEDLMLRMSEEEKKAIYKKYFEVEEVIDKNRDQYIYKKSSGESYLCSMNLHKWYERLPFETSFVEIKQLIRASKTPDDRIILLIVLLELAGDDSKCLQQVLQYYFTAHINEQKMYKVRFLDKMVKTKHVYRFSEECWKPTNDLFTSLEAYGDEDYANYNEVIVFYHILHDKEVPDVIFQKYLNNYRHKEQIERLTDEESVKIYNYLVKLLESQCRAVRAKEGISSAYYDLIKNYIAIVQCFNKCLIDYPTIIYALTDMIQFKPDEYYYSSNYYEAIVCHHIVKGTAIPVKVMERHLANGYSNNVSEMTDEDKLKVFDYFVIDFENRSAHLRRGAGLNENVVDLTKSFIRFLRNSEKLLGDYPYVISLMKDIVLAEPNSLSYPSRREKTARRMLFDVSVLMSQEERVFIDVLKHDATLLHRHIGRLPRYMRTVNVIYINFLKKLLTYFPDDFAVEFQNSYKAQLKECETDSKNGPCVVANLSLIFKKRDFIEAIQDYLPKNHKVEWEEEDICIVNIRKYLAANLHRVRPLLEMDTIYEFAKGDYLQYALPSLLSICTAQPAQMFTDNVLPRLLNSPVSVQKHGIRLAFRKLSLDAVSPVLTGMWSKSKNVSIRNTVFESTFTLLTEQVNENKTKVLWELLKTFVTSLQEDEERAILTYNLSHLESLPKLIRCESCQICYRQMERIQDKVDWDDVRKTLMNYMCDWLVDGMDPDFVSKVLLENFEKLFDTNPFHLERNSYVFRRLLAEYLTSSEKEQIDRYEKVARPIFSTIIGNWDKHYEDGSVQAFFGNILTSFTDACRRRFLGRGNCSDLFNCLFKQFENVCSVDKHFVYHLKMKFLLMFNEAVQGINSAGDAGVYRDSASRFSRSCGQFLIDLVDSHFSSIRVPYMGAVHEFTEQILSNCSPYESGTFLLSFVDNLVKGEGPDHNYLLGLYFYNRLRINVEEFEKESGGYYEMVTKRIEAIENKEIKFHLTTRLL